MNGEDAWQPNGEANQLHEKCMNINGDQRPRNVCLEMIFKASTKNSSRRVGLIKRIFWLESKLLHSEWTKVLRCNVKALKGAKTQ